MGVVCAIAALNELRVIGAQGGIPWNLPEDKKLFHDSTRGHVVLMGRATYESLPDHVRPLPERTNVVATRDRSFELPDGVLRTDDAAAFVREWRAVHPGDARLWVAGGAEIYAATLPQCDELLLSHVHSTDLGDTYFPKFEEDFRLTEREEREGFSICRYVRRDAAGQ